MRHVVSKTRNGWGTGSAGEFCPRSPVRVWGGNQWQRTCLACKSPWARWILSTRKTSTKYTRHESITQNSCEVTDYTVPDTGFT